jgi:diguanylate cyclase (GGDEF)-like protein
LARTVDSPGVGTLRLTSLRLRIGLAVLTAASAFGGGAAWYATTMVADAERETADETTLAIARTFADDFTRRDLRDRATLERRLRRLREVNPDVRQASVYTTSSGEAQVVASTLQRAAVLPHDVAPMTTGRPAFHYERSHGVHLAEVALPVRDERGYFAVVGLYYDLGHLDALYAARRTHLLVAGVATAILLTILLSLALSYGIFQPLDRLRVTTHRIARGDLDARLNWARSDELGHLARDFDDMASELERSHRQLEVLALEDSLTGLANHRAVQDRLAGELGRSQREGSYPVSLVAMDIDRFKGINDRLGHAAGDEALKALAQSLRANVRPSDICGRVGGDEFVIVLPRTDALAAEEVVRRVRAAVEDIGIGPTRESVTISAGIAEFPRDAEGVEELRRLADSALYSAKRSGRDRAMRYSARHAA